MSSSKYIQRIFSADESSVGEGSIGISNRSVIEEFVASEAISAGATVSLDVSQSTDGEILLKVAEADGTDNVPVGIYLGYELDQSDDVASGDITPVDAASGDRIKVLIRGIAVEALVDGSGDNISSGDKLTFSTDGKLVLVTQFRTDLGDGTGTTTGTVAQPDQVVAIALEANTTDSTSKVLVINPCNF